MIQQQKPIPEKFEDLSHEQIMEFAKIGFETYWEIVNNKVRCNNSFNSTMQKIDKDVVDSMQKINKVNQ